ncbi:MAG: LuxR C-terminal-related transcriptional regulator [Pseudomonadota bacterium]
MLPNTLCDLSDRLDSAETPDAVISMMADFATNFGITSLRYGYDGALKPEGVRPPRIIGRTDPDFDASYNDGQAYQYDPSVSHAANSTRHMWTGLDFERGKPGTDPRYIEFLEQVAIDFGLNAAIVLPVHNGADRTFGGFITFSELNGPELVRSCGQDILELRLGALLADQALRALDLEAEALGHQTSPLSPREEECLKWLASGDRNDRIAQRMGITNPTVEAHLASIRRKLKATTREQAVAIAVRRGWI